MDRSVSETNLREELRRRYDRKSDASPIRFLARYVLTVIPCGATLVLCHVYQATSVYLMLGVVSGFTANALGILMHEGCHYFFHRDKRRNDLLADCLVCLPIFNTVAGYRVPHFEHHRQSGNTSAPYYELYGRYVDKMDILRCFLQDFVGLTAVKAFLARYANDQAASVSQPRYALPGLLIVQSSIFAIYYYLCTSSLAGYLFAWVLPLMIVPAVINRLRTIVEHTSLSRGGSANRSTVPTSWEYLLIAPYGYSYHFEHHLLMTIPYFELRRAHESLVSKGVQFSTDQVSPYGFLLTFISLLRRFPSR